VIGVELERRGLTDPNPHNDLWEWRGRWSGGDLPTYSSRRQYMSKLFAPLIVQLKQLDKRSEFEIFDTPTGWEKIDLTAHKIAHHLKVAQTEEEFQAIGLYCREILISVSQEVYDPSKHVPSDSVVPSDTDAKRMFDAYIGSKLVGSTNEAARRYAKAAFDLANDLQHRRNADFVDAALCAEAAISVMNLVAILAGRRNGDI
jgi:hypothetical protein